MSAEDDLLVESAIQELNFEGYHDQAAAVERLRAAQPVQQPAAVVGQANQYDIDAMRKALRSFSKFAPQLRDNPPTDRLAFFDAGNLTVADIFSAEQALKPFTEPVPAAGVQGDALRVEAGEDIGCMREQATAWLAVHAALTEACPGWHNSGVPTTGIERAVTAIKGLAKRSTVQPDSGRDAALVHRPVAEIRADIASGGGLGRMDRLLKELDRALAAHPAPSSDAKAPQSTKVQCPNCRGEGRFIKEVMLDFASCDREETICSKCVGRGVIYIAAHPAPSSDATLVTRSLAEIDADLAKGGGLGCTDRLIKERKAFLAAHPANGAQAGLSDEEIDAIWLETAKRYADYKQFARAILAAAAPQKKEG